MAEPRTFSRPYAKAIFEIAKSTNSFEDWGNFINTLSIIAQNPTVKHLLGNYMIAPSRLADFFLEVASPPKQHSAKEHSSKDQSPKENFVKILAQKRRLNLLPEIATLYAELVAEDQKILPAEFISAIELDQSQQKQMADSLSKFFGNTLELTFNVDPNLIGGFIVRAKDTVIDGSIKGQLAQLQATIGG